MLVELRESLESLLALRLQEGKWDDSEKEPGLLRTLEAMSCFGSPAYYFEKLRIYDRRFEIVKIPEEILNEDLNCVIDTVKSSGFPPSPYLDSDFKKLGVPYEKGKTDFIDTLSFFTSSMLDVMEYYEVVYKKECPRYEEIQSYLKEAFNFLISNAFLEDKNAYWFWGNKDLAEKIPSIYFTWSAVVALSYAIQSPFAPLSEADKVKMKSLLQGVLNWVSGIVKEDPDYPEKRWRISYPRFADSVSGRHESLLIYVGSIFDWLSQLDIIVTRDLAQKILYTFLDIYRNQQMWRFEGGSHLILLPGRIAGSKGTVMIEYEDRSYEYLLLSVLSWFYMLHHENKMTLQERDSNDLDSLIDDLRKKLITDRDPQKKLWKKDGFLLYLTQRAIESITTYLRYVYPYKGMELSLQDAIRLAVESAFEDMKPQLIEQIYKNIELLQKGILEKKGVS